MKKTGHGKSYVLFFIQLFTKDRKAEIKYKIDHILSVNKSYKNDVKVLHRNPPKGVRYGAEQDNDCKDRAKILDHDAENLLSLKRLFPVEHFFFNSITPMTLETRRQVATAAMGIITELVRKSKKSRNCIPMISTAARGP